MSNKINPQEAQLTKHRRREATQLSIVNSTNTVNFDNYAKSRKSITLVPKSRNQETYIDLLEDPQHLIVFATGPAGTGKTMLAVLAALKAFRAGNCSKIEIGRAHV